MERAAAAGSAKELLLLIGIFEGSFDPSGYRQGAAIRASLESNYIGQACERWFGSTSLQASALRWRKLGHNARRIVYLRCLQAC